MTTTTDPALDEQVDDAEVANGSSAPHDGPGNELVPRDDAGELSTMDGSANDNPGEPDPDPDDPDADDGDDDDDADDPSEDLPTSSQPPALPASSDASEPVATGLSTKQKVMLGAFFAIAFVWALVLFWLWVRGVSLLVIVPGGILVSIALARRQLLGRLFAPATSRRPVPTQGRPALLYALLNNRVIDIPYVPDLSDEEKAAIRESEEESYEAQLQNEILVERTCFDWLNKKIKDPVEWVITGPTGGVGKGTVATSMAAIAAENYQAPVLIVDSRDGVGNIALRFGLVVYNWDDDFRNEVILHATPTVRQSIELSVAGQFDDAVSTQHHLRSAPTVRGQLDIIGCDIKGKNGRALPGVEVNSFGTMMDKLMRTYKNAFHENANVRGLPLDNKLMERGKIPVFVHRPRRHFSAPELDDALDVYRQNEVQKAKIQKHGVLKVLETGPKDTVEDYARMFDIPEHRTFLVPKHDYYIVPEDAFDVRDEHGHSVLQKLDTSSLPPEPIVDVAAMPDEGFLAHIQSLNAGLFTLLSDAQVNKFFQWCTARRITAPRWAIAPEKKEDSRDHGES